MRTTAISLALFLASAIAWFHIDFLGYAGEFAGDWVFKYIPSLPDPLPIQEEIARQRLIEDRLAPTWFTSERYFSLSHVSAEDTGWDGLDYWFALVFIGRLFLPIVGLALIAYGQVKYKRFSR